MEFAISSLKRTPFRITIDDLGLFPEVEESVLELGGRGVPLFASWLTNYHPPTATYFERQRGIGNGLHFNILEGRGTLRRSSLVNSEGNFCRRWLDFLGAGKTLRRDVEGELENQILRAKSWFGHLTHLDTHLHLHAIPWIYRLMENAARRHDVPHIRNCYEPWMDAQKFQPKILLLEVLQVLRRQKEIPCHGISVTFELDAQKCFALLAQGRSREFVFHTCLKVPPADPEPTRFTTIWDREKRFQEHLQLSLLLDLLRREMP